MQESPKDLDGAFWLSAMLPKTRRNRDSTRLFCPPGFQRSRSSDSAVVHTTFNSVAPPSIHPLGTTSATLGEAIGSLQSFFKAEIDEVRGMVRMTDETMRTSELGVVPITYD